MAAAASSPVAAASLLDEYLQVTATGRLQQQQHQQQAVHSTGVQAQTLFLHQRVLSGVHAALDSALTAAGQQQSPPRFVWGLPEQTPAPGASSSSSTTPRGIFRAMRQADASAMYAEQLAAAGGGGDSTQQDPVFAGTADALTSEVRLLADHAAFSTKLAKLQQDMEVRSYRQGLLHTLQQPSALFQRQPCSQQLSVRTSLHQQQRQEAGAAPRSRSAVMWEARDRPAAVPTAVLQRPCTAPKPSLGPQQHQQQVGAGLELDGGAGGVLAASASPRLLHLKQLSELELPWKPAADTRSTLKGGGVRTVPSGLSNNSLRGPAAAAAAATTHLQAGRPRTTTSSSGMLASAGPQLFGPQQHHQQQQQQQGSSVPRSASAVAALQQSLGELQKLKAKFAQQREQHEQLQQQQVLQRQQQERQKQERQQQLRRVVATPGGTWLQQQQEPLGSSRAAVWADIDTAADSAAGPASRHDLVWRQQHQHVQPSWQGAAAASLSQGYSDARQQALRAAAVARSQSAPRMQRAWGAAPADWSEALLSSRRQHLGLHNSSGSRSPTGAALFGRAAGLTSSWDDSMWHIHQRRQQQQQHQRQQQSVDPPRPQTAAARFGGGSGGMGGLFSTSSKAGTVQAQSSAAGRNAGAMRPGAAAVLGPSDAVNRGGTLSGWLSSSPLKRAVGRAPAKAGNGAGGTASASARQQQPSWLQSAGQQVPRQPVVGPCQAAMLASMGGAAASKAAAAAEPAQRVGLSGYSKLQQAAATSRGRAWTDDGSSSVVSDDSRASSWAAGGAVRSAGVGGISARRESAYAAALTRVQAAAAKQATSSHRGRRAGSRRAAGCSSSSDTEDDSSSCA